LGRANNLIRKIHIYAGLLAFSQFLVYGIAGLAATFHRGPGRSETPRSVEHIPFDVPPSSSDKQVAALVYDKLRFPLTSPVPDWAIRHTADHHLLLDFYNVNGLYRVTVLENEGRLRVENVRKGVWLFLDDIHAATAADEDTPPVVRAWAFWNEVAMWTLLLFCASGAWLWLTARMRFGWAWISFAAGSACLAALWAVLR
jgi:hypothetical protein